MITINRSLVLASVLAVTLAAFATVGPRAADPLASDEVAQRFPLPAEMFTPVPLTTYVAPKFIAAQKSVTIRTPRPTRVQLCAVTPNGWPYVSDKCLVG